MEKKRCPGCMKEKAQSPVCEHCGYNENVPNYPHQLAVGTVLRGQYTVGKVLGQGGFGITYIGWDESLESPVAIKEFYPNNIVTRDSATSSLVNCISRNAEAMYTDNRERFLREARVLAKLQNVPGIVRVHNLFTENNTAYIIMEYVEGIDLKHYIRSRNRLLTVEEAFAVLRPVLYALSKVHEAELVHRDISPDNIMIQPDGSAKLLDFGAAREVENAEVDKDLPQSTEAILKHGFAPIEQYRRRGSLGPWTDVYALCATMYYCLTGKVPNSAPERIMGDDNVNWKQIPGLSEQQAAILEKGLAILPENRVRTMRELHNGLFGQTTTGFTQVKKEEPKPEPKKKPGTSTHTVFMKSEKAAPVVMEIPKKKRIPIPLMGGIIGLVTFIILSVLTSNDIRMTASSGDAAVPESVVVTEENSPPAAPESLSVLMSDLDSSVNYHKEYAAYQDYPVFGSDYKRSQIEYITFSSNLKYAPEDAWDASAAQDGSILAWVEDDRKLYLAAEGGMLAPEDSTCLFAGYINLKNILFHNALYTENVVSMSHMFTKCSSLQSIDLNSFDTSNVTDMSWMFSDCKALSALDLRSFNTSRVTDLSYIFCNCEGLRTLDMSSFDTSNVTDMSYMFNWCKSLQTLNLSNFNTSHVTNMSGIFNCCDGLSSLDVSSFDTSRVTNMHGMFSGCESLSALDVSNFDTSNVTDMSSMFNVCNDLVTLDLRNFDTSSVTAMDMMFANCIKLKSIDVSSFDTAKVTNMKGMFHVCMALETLDIGNFDTSKVTDMTGMFYQCGKLDTSVYRNVDEAVIHEQILFG